MLVNKHQLWATNQTHAAAQNWSCMFSDLTSHVATDTTDSESCSINTDVGPDVGYWFNANPNYLADLIRMSVDMAPIIWNLESARGANKSTLYQKKEELCCSQQVKCW